MTNYENRRSRILEYVLRSEQYSEELALEIFRFQYDHNSVYQSFCDSLGKTGSSVNFFRQIPFLPVSAFKHHKVKTGEWDAEVSYESSRTSGQNPSVHYVRKQSIYHDACVNSFYEVYGDPSAYTWLALLPSYLEREGSSLVSMVKYFMQLSDRDHGFFLNDFKSLVNRLNQSIEQHEKVILIGVSFALLDFAEKYPIRLSDKIHVMETGGMKGRKEEVTRVALHDALRNAFGGGRIHSEYGMTELMHQFYAPSSGVFQTSKMTKVLVRSINDPFETHESSANGLLNIFDPGNIDSCAFIATDDIATIHENGTFEILGRSDNSEMRGCNLLYTSRDNFSID